MVSDKTKHDSDVKARDSVAKRAVETLGTRISTTGYKCPQIIIKHF
jgi:hypothetical protein